EQPSRVVAVRVARTVRRADRAAARRLPRELAHAARLAPAARRAHDDRESGRRRRLRLRGRLRPRVQETRRHAAGRVAPLARSHRGARAMTASRAAALAATCALALAGRATAAAAEVVLSIVGTNDLHGRLFTDERGRGGLPVLGGYIDNLRAARAADSG